MTMLYSPAAGGFFDPALEYPGGLPADGIAITPAHHAQLLDGLASGQQITVTRAGRVVLVSPPPSRAALLRAIKHEAARRIEAIAPLWRQLNDARAPTPQSAARFAAIDAIRGASALIEQDLAATADKGLRGFPVADHPLWPTLNLESD